MYFCAECLSDRVAITEAAWKRDEDNRGRLPLVGQVSIDEFKQAIAPTDSIPAVGEIWVLPSDDPFIKPIRWRIVDVKNGYVQYVDPDHPDGIRWSNTVLGFAAVCKREGNRNDNP